MSHWLGIVSILLPAFSHHFVFDLGHFLLFHCISCINDVFGIFHCVLIICFILVQFLYVFLKLAFDLVSLSLLYGLMRF